MRSVIRHIVLVMTFAWVGGLILGTPADVHAQSTAIQVRVPFEFHVGATKLPAGKYTVIIRMDSVTVDDGKGHAAVGLTNSVPRTAKETPFAGSMVFSGYQDYYFLSEIAMNGYATRGLVKSSMETEIAKTSDRTLIAARF